jgi:hypothetical protein
VQRKSEPIDIMGGKEHVTTQEVDGGEDGGTVVHCNMKWELSISSTAQTQLRDGGKHLNGHLRIDKKALAGLDPLDKLGGTDWRKVVLRVGEFVPVYAVDAPEYFVPLTFFHKPMENSSGWIRSIWERNWDGRGRVVGHEASKRCDMQWKLKKK